MGDPQRAERVLAAAASRLDPMVSLLRRLIEAESPSRDPAAQAEVLGLLESELTGRGFEVRRLRGKETGGGLFAAPAARASGGPCQLLLGHADTVWPLGTVARRPPVIEDGVLRGPGGYDMKAGLVQGLFAIDVAREVGGAPLQVAPLMLINTDEEIGSRETTPHIKRVARIVDRVFVLEPSLGPQGKLKTARKGIGRFEVRIAGKAAHAGLDPEAGASAILELALVIQRLFALNDPARGVTVNVGTIDGGLQPNVIAPESKAVVDVRVPTQEDADRVEAQILALTATTPGTSLTIQGGFGRPPMEPTPGNRLLWAVAREAATDLGLEIGESAVGGGSDGNTTSLFAPTLDGLGPVGEGAHAEHESLVVAAMVERAALLASLLLHPPLGRKS